MNLYKIKEPFILEAVDDFKKIFNFLWNHPTNVVAEKSILGAGIMGHTERSPWNKGYWIHDEFFKKNSSFLTDSIQKVFDIPFVVPSIKIHVFNHPEWTYGGYLPHTDGGYHNGKTIPVPATLNMILMGGSELAVTNWYAVEETRHNLSYESRTSAYASIENPYDSLTLLDSHTMYTGEACIFNSARYHDVIVDKNSGMRVTLGMHFDPSIGTYADVVHQFSKRGWL